MGFIGYINCEACGAYTPLDDPQNIKIWYHPDDKPLAEVKCSKCGNITSSRIGYDHLNNFRIRGCSLNELNDKFESDPLTEEKIDEWVKQLDADQEKVLSFA